MQTADQIPRSTRGSTSQPSLRRSRSLRTTRPVHVPSKQTYKTTTTVLPLDLSSDSQSPFLTQANRLHTNKSLREGSYQPLYSRAVRTSVSPERFPSHLRSLSRSVSPYRSPSRDSSPLPVEFSSLSHRTTRPFRKRNRPRVVSSKRKLGNYYDRLLSRRATQPAGAEAKYWPYIDVEDIEDTYTGDLIDDTESYRGVGDTYSRGGADSYGQEGGDTYIIDTKGYPDDSYYCNYEGDSDDIPNFEYVPFRPKIRAVSPERDYAKLSVVPYLPKRDPTKTTVADDIAFNAIVAASAERARKALERVNWDDYDQAGLVLSVEGEYKAPSSDIPLGFRYVSRPLTLKEPISRIVSAYDSDNSFTKYMKDLQSFREGIRTRLEEGYRALDTTYKSYVPAITKTETEYKPRVKPYHKRLREQEGYKYGHSLELYPVTSRESTLSLPSSREAIPESHSIRLYDSGHDPSSKLSTFDKVQIKVCVGNETYCQCTLATL